MGCFQSMAIVNNNDEHKCAHMPYRINVPCPWKYPEVALLEQMSLKGLLKPKDVRYLTFKYICQSFHYTFLQ